MRMIRDILVILIPLAVVDAAIPPPVVNLGYGKYQGIVTEQKGKVTYTRFLGIRYAAPPTGSLRFSAPAAPTVSAGVHHANVQPSGCLSGTRGSAATNPFRALMTRASDASPAESEDCLFLNVFFPGELGQKKNLPVIVWIHGGGYIEGSAARFDGNDLIREAGGEVVAVEIQYRLGVFGFLAGQAVKDGGALNAGLLDQQFALKWVQQYISLFGGDPQQVTIWGDSAGGGSVLQHVIANNGRTSPPLFRAAITSSSFLPSQYMYNDTIPENLYTQILKQTKCSSAADTLACLRKVSAGALKTAGNQIGKEAFFGTFVPVPVVDGSFIIDRPTQLLGRKQLNGEIVLSVTNSVEGTSFVKQATAAKTNPAAYVAQLFPKLDQEQSTAAAAQYAGLGSRAFIINAIMGESIFICPTYFLLRGFDGIAFKGEFAVPPGSHGEDSRYYFPTGHPPGYKNAQFNRAFAESFLDFVRFLDPSKKWDSRNTGLPSWPMWNGTNEMLFNKTTKGKPDIHVIHTSTTLLKRCDFWESVSSLTAQ